MTTFSQLVDNVVQQSNRPNLLTRIATVVANVIYELHFTRRRGVIFYAQNRREQLLTLTADQVFNWTAPPRLQIVEAARYDGILDYKNKQVYATPVKPGRRMNDEKYYFYRNASGFIFVNCGSIGQTISVAYFQRLAPLVYYPVGQRPATWDESTATWSYLNAVTQQDKEAAEALVSNWLTQEHDAVILEGSLAAIWKEAGDQRSIPTFARYSSLREALEVQESVSI